MIPSAVAGHAVVASDGDVQIVIGPGLTDVGGNDIWVVRLSLAPIVSKLKLLSFISTKRV